MTMTANTVPRVVATSRQTRFNPLVQGDAGEVDLHDVTISVGERELLVDGRVRLKNGVKYGMIGRYAFGICVSRYGSWLTGRNGCGKSTVLQAIADKLIPGIPPTLRIHIVSQVEENSQESDIADRTALQRVLDGHVERTSALREKSGKPTRPCPKLD